MSKNRYILPFKDSFYVEYGGISKKDSHSWDIISQRYAYDFEIRDTYNSPYHDNYLELKNYYSYNKDIIAPLDGYVVSICNCYQDTNIQEGRPIVCDCDDVRGNHIIIKHKYGEYSLIAHILKDSFQVKEGDIVRQGQIIAKVGNSGNTNGPHIHFQIQDRLDSKSAIGIKINFKSIKIKKSNRHIYRRYIKHGYTVENKLVN